MTLEDLINQYRVAAQDRVDPGFVSEPDLIDMFNEAEKEAAIRGRLIYELIDPAVCEISVSAGQRHYSLHPSLYEISHLSVKSSDHGCRQSVYLVSAEALDHKAPGWRDEEAALPAYAIQTDRALVLAPTPSENSTLHLEGYRLPLQKMESLGDKPEISEAHHPYLHLWVLHKVFSIPDAEMFDPSRSSLAEQEFTRYFGPRPDSDLRRITREDVEHHVEAFFI